MSSIIYNAVREIFRPTPKLQVEDWLRTHVRFERGPILGAFDTKNSPWIKEPLTQLKNHETREIICACSVQSAKTALAEGAMLYLIAEAVVDMLAVKGYDSKMGARPLSRKIDELIRVPLSKRILFDRLNNCDIAVGLLDDAVNFVVTPTAAHIVDTDGIIRFPDRASEQD